MSREQFSRNLIKTAFFIVKKTPNGVHGFFQRQILSSIEKYKMT